MTEVNEVNIARGGAMAEGGGGGRGKLSKILLTVIVLAIVGGGGYYAWTLFFPGDKNMEDAAARNGGGTGASPGGGPRPGSVDLQDNPTGYVKNPEYLDLGNFIVNLADGRRYLKVNIQVVLGNSEAREFLEKRMADVKHVVLAKLQSLTSDQMRNPAERATLLIDLMNKIHTLFPPDKDDIPGDDNRPIKKVLFTEFYLQ